MIFRPLLIIGILAILSGCQEDAQTVKSSIYGDLCPPNFSLVSKSFALGTESFCLSRDLMAYDSKGRLTTRSGSANAITVTHSQAQNLCNSLGANYDLISNGEYQAAAREVELLDENWSGNQIGRGSLGKDRTSLKLLSGDDVDGAGNTIRAFGVDAYSTWTKDALNSYYTYGSNFDVEAGLFHGGTFPVVAINAPYDDVTKWFAPYGDYSLIPDVVSGAGGGLGMISLNSGYGYVTRGPLTGSTYHAEFTMYSSAAWVGFHCVYHP